MKRYPPPHTPQKHNQPIWKRFETLLNYRFREFPEIGMVGCRNSEIRKSHVVRLSSTSNRTFNIWGHHSIELRYAKGQVVKLRSNIKHVDESYGWNGNGWPGNEWRNQIWLDQKPNLISFVSIKTWVGKKHTQACELHHPI